MAGHREFTIPLPKEVRIRHISWDVWVFFLLFIWIGIFHMLFGPMTVRKQLLLDWLPSVAQKVPHTLNTGKDLEEVVLMSSTLTFTVLDIFIRSLAWWLSTYTILRYAFSKNGVRAILVPIKGKYMLVAERLKVYRPMILSATLISSILYIVKDYLMYWLMTSKGIDPVSAGWLFIVNLGGILSMIVVTIIWVLLPDTWLERLWLIRVAVTSDKQVILSVDIAPRTFIGYFVAFTMVSFVIVLITYPSLVYLLPVVFIPLFIEWWMGGFLISLIAKFLVGLVKPTIQIESEGVLV